MSALATTATTLFGTFMRSDQIGEGGLCCNWPRSLEQRNMVQILIQGKLIANFRFQNSRTATGVSRCTTCNETRTKQELWQDTRRPTSAPK